MSDLLPDAARKFVQSSDATPPSVGGSMFNSFVEGFGSLANLGIEKGILPKNDFTDRYTQAFNRINYENAKEQELTTSSQMAFRKIASAPASFLGGMLDPVSMAAGIATGGIGSVGIRAFAPQIAAKQLARKQLIKELGEREAVKQLPRTVSEVATAGAHGGAFMVGYSVPAATLEAYNADTRTLDKTQLATEVATNGAMGVGFGVLGYGAGVLWHKVFGKNGRVPMPGTPESVDTLKNLMAKRDAGEIDHEEFSLLHDFYTNPKDPTIPERLTTYLKNNGHQVDSVDQKALFEILTENDLNNLKGIYPNELNNADVAGDKDALSQNVMHNRLDEHRKNPEVINGIRGAMSYLQDKMANRSAMSAKADEMLDTHLFKGLEDKMPFDQDDIFDAVYKSRLFYDEYAHPLQFVVPEEVEKAIRHVKEYEFAEYKRQQILDYEYTKANANEELKEKEFFHGSGSLENLTQFDVSRMDPNSLFGPGLYLTDRKEIAMSYSRSLGYKSAAPELLPGKIFKLKFKENPKLIDVEKKGNPEVFKIIQEAARKNGYEIANDQRTQWLDGIFKKMRQDLAVAVAEGEYYFDMGNIMKDINNALEKAGYDGFLHIGGKYLGKGKKLHNVAVLFGHEHGEGVEKSISNPVAKLKQEEVDIGKDFEEKVHEIRAGLKSRPPRELLLSASDELLNIKEKLLGEKGLPDNFKETKEYKRLVELTEVWHNAQTLLDRVNLEHEYERQQAFLDIAEAFTSVLDSDTERFANPERVTSYLKERIDTINRNSGERSYSGTGQKPNVDELSKVIEEAKKLPAEHVELMTAFDEQVASTDAPLLVKEYDESKKRYDNFSENEGALKALIDCFGER